MNEEFERKLDELARLVTQAKHTVLFGGAGMSTESGLADFRSAVSGLYNNKEFYGYSAERILSREFFEEHPEIMFNFYRTELLNLDARPNLAHFALAWMEEKGMLSSIITQNGDALHQRAGSRKCARKIAAENPPAQYASFRTPAPPSISGDIINKNGGTSPAAEFRCLYSSFSPIGAPPRTWKCR